MSQGLGNNFDRAQRAYDNQMPPEDNRIECDKCEGTGQLPMSDCHEVEIVNGMCSKCQDPCGLAKCDKCDGEGMLWPKEQPERDDCDTLEEKYFDEIDTDAS